MAQSLPAEDEHPVALQEETMPVAEALAVVEVCCVSFILIRNS